MQNAREISDALGGIPALAKVCGVQYRLAYGYIERNSIPAAYDIMIVAALERAGSEIGLFEIASWRASALTFDDPGVTTAKPDGEIVEREDAA